LRQALTSRIQRIGLARTHGRIMVARRSFLMAVWIGVALAPVGVMAAHPSAATFVEAIYAPYKVKDGKGNLLDSDATVKRYFEPRLAALIIKDRNKAAKRGDVSTLEMDPFIDAQDWDISAVDVAVRDTAADKASASHSRTWASRPPWCLSSSSSGTGGGSPTSIGAASEPCAHFSSSDNGASVSLSA
jgi:hypothetical protein